MNTQAELVFVRLLIPYLMGICAFYKVEAQNTNMILNYASLFLFCVLLFLNLGYSKFKIYRNKPATTAAVYLLSFCIGALITQTHKENLAGNYFAKVQGDFLKVRVDDEPQVKNNLIHLKAIVFQTINGNSTYQTSGHLLLTVKLDSTENLNVRYGDEFIIPANFHDLKEAQNPFQFDVRSWYANQNIYQQSFLASEELLKISSHQGNPFLTWALNLRKRQVEIYQKHIRDSEAFAVASTLILGYRSDLSADTLMAYANTGTIHALSVSGMHVGIIYLVLNSALGFLEKKRAGKLLKLLLVISLIWFYALLSGLSPSVLRSVIMLSIYVCAKSFRRNINSYNIIAFSAFCMLLYNPFLLYDVGFQLSYISVLGLVYLQPQISCWFIFKYKALNKLWAALALSLSAQIVTFPLSIYYFHQFPTYFLISNLFILLPVSLIMYLGIIILLGRLYFLMPIFEWLISFTNRGLQGIAKLPFASINGIWLDKLQLLFLIAGTALLLHSLAKYRKAYMVPSFLCILIVISSCSYKKWIAQEQRKLIFFSLSKDYATALIRGNHALLVTNLNSSSPAYRFNVQPTLSQLQVVSTTFVNTHQNVKSTGLLMKDHQISFFDQSIFIADTCFNNKSLATSTPMNYLWLCGNSKIKLDDMLIKLQPDVILIDGTNSNHSAEHDAQQAKNFKLPAYNLKKLKAYLVNINK